MAKVVVSFEGSILTEVDLDKAVTMVGRHPACDIVLDHPAISARHMLVSGGNPGPKDYAYFDEVCATLTASFGMHVDVMMPPRGEDPGFVDRLASGLHRREQRRVRNR